MAGARGKPIHLTNGERRLLLGLLEAEVGRLAGQAPADLEAAYLRRLRLRQYRRLALELKVARPEPGEG